ncbi:MAG: amino acid ABC transporter ATP-binding protein [Candidatus Rokubacteria bacterium]|nr:amino acid ABC transporter ATP-binding protein [Candidatus Rokubacteria bacterium]
MIEAEKLNKSFGPLHVIRDFDLRIEENEVVVICGPSGSGKSTLLRLINRLESADSGRLEVLGENVVRDIDIRRLRARIGFVFQQFNLYPHLTALQNIALAPRKVLRMPKATAEERAMELLRRVRLPTKAQSYPAQLSGGEQQRVAIARALAMQPRIILFDEPTSALDPEMVGEVLDVMRELTRQGFTIICVTHEMGFAREAASRVIFMDHGRIVEANTPEEFFSKPRQARTQEFLAQIR